MVMVVIGGIIINALVSSPAFLPPLLGGAFSGAGVFIQPSGVLEVVSDEVLNRFWSWTVGAEFWREPRIAAIGLLLDGEGVHARAENTFEAEVHIFDQDTHRGTISGAADCVTGWDVAFAFDLFCTIKVQRDFNQAVKLTNFLNGNASLTAFRDGVELLWEALGAVWKVFHIALLALEEDDVQLVAEAVHFVIDKVAEPSWVFVHHVARLLADGEVGNLAVCCGELAFKSRRDADDGTYNCIGFRGGNDCEFVVRGLWF